MHRTRLATLALSLPLLVAPAVGCAPGGAAPRALAPAHAERSGPPEGAPRSELPWATFSAETFARAKAERRYVILDGSAEWCHWCHVMEATTYHDASVRALIDAHFIAVKVDVDSRPDLEERYGDYGWPATILFSPDATELGKYRGYIAPETFAAILREVVASGAATTEAGADPGRAASYVVGASRPAPARPLPEEQLQWIQRATDIELDEYWDESQGGWGRAQKAPLGWDNAWMLSGAERGDAEAKRKVLFTLDQQAKLIDPVWGGIYQYSAARDWDHAHFEKLMTFQAPALENYAVAYRLTGDAKHLARARAMHGYLERFMRSPEGGFYTTQDADVNAHDRTKPFMNGHDYYALGERARLARGLPRVDTNEYARENGLAIGAYAALYEATKDPAVLAAAEKAARRVLETHRVDRGVVRGISHGVIDGEAPKQLYLSDNAAFGWGLMRLYEVTRSDAWVEHARRIADFMLADLADHEGGGFFASTIDPDAVGVFATRRIPFEDNVMALRMFARLARATTDAKYKTAIDRVLRAISTPEEIKGRGRMLGDYLLALEETKGVRGIGAKD
ncbi:MAG: thioredoxin domain-containing protein [Labilithrix sp.]|nr:thioredoxin domain-containing protein [Labilithrix sp.]